MKQVKLTITQVIKVVSMQSGKLMSTRDGGVYVYYGKSKSECNKAAKAAGRKGRKEWSLE